MLHGGIVVTLLDEAMTRLACELYGPCVTAEMTVRYVILSVYSISPKRFFLGFLVFMKTLMFFKLIQTLQRLVAGKICFSRRDELEDGALLFSLTPGGNELFD